MFTKLLNLLDMHVRRRCPGGCRGLDCARERARWTQRAFISHETAKCPERKYCRALLPNSSRININSSRCRDKGTNRLNCNIFTGVCVEEEKTEWAINLATNNKIMRQISRRILVRSFFTRLEFRQQNHCFGLST